jgi:hypothetical protein
MAGVAVSKAIVWSSSASKIETAVDVVSSNAIASVVVVSKKKKPHPPPTSQPQVAFLIGVGRMLLVTKGEQEQDIMSLDDFLLMAASG